MCLVMTQWHCTIRKNNYIRFTHLKSESQEQQEQQDHETVKTKKAPLREGPNVTV